MKTHTQGFKNNLVMLGKEIDNKITYTLNEDEIELSNETINSINPHYEGNILKSVMKQLDIDSNVEIPIETEINYQFGLKVGNSYEYLDFGNYIVYSSEKQEDTDSWKITCYDKMLYAMKDYENLNVTYPITIRNYLIALCNKIGLTFANSNDIFTNYDKNILEELYLDADGNSINYTFRDVLDELAQTTGSIICINNDDELEIRYPNQTNDTINEEFLKDINVNFGEKFGPVNSIVLTRAGGSDSVYLRDEQSVTLNGLCEIKIEDNQIMNLNNRADFLQGLLDRLDGLEYYYNDFSSQGILYYDLYDKYNVSIGNNTYNCIMINDEINITQGIEENIHTDIAEETETEYQHASKDDRQTTRAYIIAKKNTAEIEALSGKVVDLSNTITGTGSITLDNAYEGTLHRLEISGPIILLYPSNTLYPSENLVILDTYLIVDENKYHLDIDKLNYTSSTNHDTFIYEDGKSWIERANGNIEQKEDILIEIKEDSEISMEQFENAIFKCIYLLQNDYTDTFTNSLDIVSKINMSPEQIEIDARKISLTGKTIDLTSDAININSRYFKVDSQGNLTATSAKLNGIIQNYKGQKLAVEINNTLLKFYDWKGTAGLVGAITSTRSTDDNKFGIVLYAVKGGILSLSYRDDEDTTISHSIIRYDTTNLNDTPWIKNTADGTMFSQSGSGVTIQNGLIKSWNLDTVSGQIEINEPNNHKTIITVKSGLISDWNYQ